MVVIAPSVLRQIYRGDFFVAFYDGLPPLPIARHEPRYAIRPPPRPRCVRHPNGERTRHTTEGRFTRTTVVKSGEWFEPYTWTSYSIEYRIPRSELCPTT